MDKKLEIITCQIHQGKEIEYIDPITTSGNILKCDICYLEQRLDAKNLILIDQVLRNQSEDDNKSTNEAVENWPPFIPKVGIKLILKQLSKYSKQNIINNTVDYFDKLEKDVIQSIRQAKKEVLKNLETMEDLQDCVNTFFAQNNKLDLVEIIMSNHQSYEEMNQKIIQFFQTQKKSAEEKRQQVESIIEKQYSIQSKHKEEILQCVKDTSLQWVQSLFNLKELNIAVDDQVEQSDIISSLQLDYEQLSYKLRDMQKKQKSNLLHITDPLKYILKYPQKVNEWITSSEEQREYQESKDPSMLEFQIYNNFATIEQKGSNYFKFTYNQSQKSLFNSTISNTEIFIAAKNPLQMNKKYIIQWKFNKPLDEMKEIKIGLIPKSDIESGSLLQAYYLGSSSHGKLNFSNCGGPLYKNNTINEVELRIDFMNNIFHFLDYPNYSKSNYVQKNTLQYINNEDYYIFMQISTNLFKEVTITNFSEVEALPEFTYKFKNQ